MENETPEKKGEEESLVNVPSRSKQLIYSMLALVAVLGTMFVLNYGYLGPLPKAEFPTLGGDFSLASGNGQVSLHDFKGKVTVISFGYTNCPDVCPTTLTKLGNAFDLLEPDELDKTQGLFITLDPERDQTAEVSEFTKFFHANIIGLSGPIDDVAKVGKNYLVASQKEASDSENEYTITHSSYLYVVRPDGMIGKLLRHSSGPQDIATAIRKWLPWAD